MKEEFFGCSCYSHEHTLSMLLDEEDGDLYTSIFLNQYMGFFKRVWIAIKYVFGYKCVYGHFDCFSMRSEDVDRFIDLLKRKKEIDEKNNKNN
jgi:hypothetical protein